MDYPTYELAPGLTLDWHLGYGGLASVVTWRFQGWLVAAVEAGQG